MGIDVFILDDLLDLRGRDLGDALCLGRQELHVANDQTAPISSARWPGQDLAGLSQSDGYAETLLCKLYAAPIALGRCVLLQYREPAGHNLHIIICL